MGGGPLIAGQGGSFVLGPPGSTVRPPLSKLFMHIAPKAHPHARNALLNAYCGLPTASHAMRVLFMLVDVSMYA
jgi:hypothetical protein